MTHMLLGAFLYRLFIEVFVGVAQLVEHGTHKPGVVGSSPTLDT
jgi:hypothetical protein